MENKVSSVFFVFDMETLVDEPLFEHAAKKWQKERYRDEEDDYVPPSVYHEPICISYLVTSNSARFGEALKKDYVFRTVFSKDPKDIVEEFFSILHKLIVFCYSKSLGFPALVSHNGNKFDIPILLARALKHYDALSDTAKKGLKQLMDDTDRWESERPNYLKNYSVYRIDTCDYFSYSSLKALSSLFGFPSKSIMEGSDVRRKYEEKEYEKIARYCAEDTLTVARILSRLLKAKGQIEPQIPEALDSCEFVFKQV